MRFTPELKAQSPRVFIAPGYACQRSASPDVNDSAAQALRLAELLEGRRMHVNLLRYNPIGPGLSGEVYEAVSGAAADCFLSRLRDNGVVAHLRQSRGPDIDAACGQLRQRA